MTFPLSSREDVRRALEGAPARPLSPIAPGLAGWRLSPSVAVCATCAGRILDRFFGCGAFRGWEAVWSPDGVLCCGCGSDSRPPGPVIDYSTIPAGRYVCHVAEVRTGQTRSGDERWAVSLVVAEGEHEGRLAAWDALVFSRRGIARAAAVMRAVGLPAKVSAIRPANLEGRTALVEVRPVEFRTPDGETIRRNEVPYDGWHRIDPGCVDCGRTEDMGDATSHGGRCAPCAHQYEQPSEPECGHSACRQNWIDTGERECVERSEGRADR